jgi:predicted methyltransferase
MSRLACLAAVLALTLSASASFARPPFPAATRAAAPDFAEDADLEAAIDGAWRTPAEKARDAWRHPLESLTFWGLQPGMTVVEIDPSGGWWTEILAPYVARTGGRYIAADRDLADPRATERSRAARQAFLAKFADPRFGSVTAVDFGMTSGLALPPASADFILVARAFHNWARVDGMTDRYLAAFYAALKPGGILAVEQHRAPEGSDPKAGTGYVPESYVIRAAQKAGFVFEARSEVNANPKDTKTYPFGVWTLPPTRQSSADGKEDPSFDHARYDAIGESDRMTLRFRKPGTP